MAIQITGRNYQFNQAFQSQMTHSQLLELVAQEQLIIGRKTTSSTLKLLLQIPMVSLENILKMLIMMFLHQMGILLDTLIQARMAINFIYIYITLMTLLDIMKLINHYSIDIIQQSKFQKTKQLLVQLLLLKQAAYIIKKIHISK